MPYRSALEAAGYVVLDFAEFGSYQGDWLAHTTQGIVHGFYGSCSGCDSFEAEFGWRASESDPERLAKFGASYTPFTPMELADFVARLHEQSAWDYDAKPMLSTLAGWGVNVDVP